MSDFRSFSKLMYWLIITKKTQRIPDVSTTNIKIETSDDYKIKIATYRPKKKPPKGSFLIAPGLDYRGPDDPRMIRFASILANAGYLVYVPYIEDYMKLEITANTHKDFILCFDHLFNNSTRLKNIKPFVFSLSFGSMLAFRLANNIERANKIGKLFVFGGYGKWTTTCQAIIQNTERNRLSSKFLDHRSIPVIFNHLIKNHLKKQTWKDEHIFKKKLTEFIKYIWDKDEFIDYNFYKNEVSKRANNMQTEQKKFFLQCCGLTDDTYELFVEYTKDKQHDFLDSLSSSEYIQCPIYLVHSKHDTVIPTKEFYHIKECLPKKNLKLAFLTSLYGHTEKNNKSLIKQTIRNSRDVYNMLRFLCAMSSK